MKVVYMGTPDFAVGPLKAIINAGHEVSAVVTQPDKQRGRGREVQMSPVKNCAMIMDCASVEIRKRQWNYLMMQEKITIPLLFGY